MAAEPGRSRVAVVGAGWAGLAAAVTLVEAGADVTVFEMAPRPGGRARSVPGSAPASGASTSAWTDELDNGQHILLGAYVRTLDLMRRVGVDADAMLQRLPLALCGPDGRGLRLPPGAAVWSFARGVLACPVWSRRSRAALLAAAARWAARGFRCDPDRTVERLTAHLPREVRDGLIAPLCVAALNTPAAEASAAVFLRVLRDALFAGPGAADLLLPRRSLDRVFPAPASDWLHRRGATLHFGHRVRRLDRRPEGWTVDEQRPYRAVVLAAAPTEAARLTAELAPAWSTRAAGLRHEPIVTLYLRAAGARLPMPMVALPDHPAGPVQFVFDHGALHGVAGRLACVASGAAAWVERGREATAAAAVAQLRHALPASALPSPPSVERVFVERRATFRCTPTLHRPDARIAPGLWAAGDYVDGPYPATLEAAVRAGVDAAHGTLAEWAATGDRKGSSD